MAKFTVGKGLDQYISNLEKLGQATDDMMGRSIYEGAKIVTDRCRAEINGLSSSDCDEEQKAGLLAGLGISDLRKTMTSQDVKVGIDGYNSKVTKSFPKGQPNVMIARSIISGTSFHPRKNDFMSRAARASQAQAEKAMQEEMDNQLKKFTH